VVIATDTTTLPTICTTASASHTFVLTIEQARDVGSANRDDNNNNDDDPTADIAIPENLEALEIRLPSYTDSGYQWSVVVQAAKWDANGDEHGPALDIAHHKKDLSMCTPERRVGCSGIDVFTLQPSFGLQPGSGIDVICTNKRSWETKTPAAKVIKFSLVVVDTPPLCK